MCIGVVFGVIDSPGLAVYLSRWLASLWLRRHLKMCCGCCKWGLCAAVPTSHLFLSSLCCLVLCYAVLCCALRCLQLDPEAEDLIRGLLTLDPDRRLGAKGVHQIQRHPFFATIPWGSLVAEVERSQARDEELTLQRLQQEGAAGAGSNGSGSNGSNGGQYSLMAEQQQREQEASRAASPASRWGL